MMMDGGWMWGGGIAMLFVWLLPLALVAAVVVLLWQRSGGGETGKTALQLLEEAYARGEIDRETFLQKRNDLTQGARKT